MKRLMFVLFTLFFAVFFFISQPVYAYSSVPSTFNQFMQLTGSGSSKVASAASKVGTGLIAGRLIAGMGIVGSVLGIALTLWDGYNRLKDGGKVNMSMPAITNYRSISDSFNSTGWGSESSVFEWKESHTTCNGVVTTTVTAHTMTSSEYIVGQKVTKTYIPNGTGCDSNGDSISDYYIDYYRYDYVTYYDTKRSVSSTYVEQPLSTPASTDASNTQVAIAVLTDALSRIDGSQTKIAAILSTGFQNQLASTVTTRQMLQDALDVLVNGVSVQKGTDYIVADEAKATPVPQGEGPGEGSSSPPPPPSNAPPISDGTCSDCQRKKTFQMVWQNLSQTASNVPLMMFINKLVINPSSGQKTTTVQVGAHGFGSHTVDLNSWGLSTFVGIIRFIIVGGSFVAAYYIIFT